MIKAEKTFPGKETYPLSRLGNERELLFFDIETTGFSADSSMVYLIGAVWKDGDVWRLSQWFADTLEAEREILDAFFAFAAGFRTLVHFNGDTFDIPFLRKRCKRLRLSHSFDGLESIDIYKRIRPYKKQLGLESMKQKAIEEFLGIAREDQFNGGELIEVYETYFDSHDECLLHLLLLHNEDDLKGMPALLPILFYPDFFAQDFTLEEVQPAADTGRLRFTFRGDPATVLPVPLSASLPSYAAKAEGDRLMLSVRLYRGTLKYFYPNYKDYYYLIFEDMAVHKSVGEYVDKTARVKATRETCYTKKAGVFLPQPEPVWAPEFKNAAAEKSGFFEPTPACFSDAAKANAYAKAVLKTVFSLKQ